MSDHICPGCSNILARGTIICPRCGRVIGEEAKQTELTHLSLFSGIGGLDLAAEWAGFQTVGQCEWADYPTKVLEKHWPDVPRWRDIRTLTGDDFYARTGLRTVTVISGGFPCQPFSVAGKRRGKEDDRYLWPEMLRVISEIRPTWVIGENVPGIVNMALDQVLTDLEGQGYACQAFNIPACGVDAPHKRARIAIVGCDTNAYGLRKREKREIQAWKNTEPCGVCKDVADTSIEGNGSISVQPREARSPDADADRSRENVADTMRLRGAAGIADTPRGEEGQPAEPFNGGQTLDNAVCIGFARDDWREQLPQPTDGCWWPVEPDVGRVANGVPSRVDRLKCLGNAVVRQQFYPFFRYINQIESEVSVCS